MGILLSHSQDIFSAFRGFFFWGFSCCHTHMARHIVVAPSSGTREDFVTLPSEDMEFVLKMFSVLDMSEAIIGRYDVAPYGTCPDSCAALAVTASPAPVVEHSYLLLPES